MAQIITRRVAGEIDGDFVVFLIGMRINKPWKLHKWLPVFLAMPRMLKELQGQPESGFLSATFGPGVIVQYWRSFEHLEAYARSHDQLHWPAWVDFNKRMAKSRGDVGIWHETYLVRAGEYEAIYSGMPLFGLGKAGRTVPVVARNESARRRIVRVDAPLCREPREGAQGPGEMGPESEPRFLACQGPEEGEAHIDAPEGAGTSGEEAVAPVSRSTAHALRHCPEPGLKKISGRVRRPPRACTTSLGRR